MKEKKGGGKQRRGGAGVVGGKDSGGPFLREGERCSIVFNHGDRAALFADAPHGSLAVESWGTSDTKFGYLRAVTDDTTGRGRC